MARQRRKTSDQQKLNLVHKSLRELSSGLDTEDRLAIIDSAFYYVEESPWAEAVWELREDCCSIIPQHKVASSIIGDMITETFVLHGL